jgi:methylated-DNA-protein-cysteine methyltransferase-like protein
MRILAAIRKIPKGRVMTYGAVAAMAELPGRARLVGRVLRDSVLAGDCPWHRVVNARGMLSTEGRSRIEQAKRLRAEGVVINAAGRIDLMRFAHQKSKPRTVETGSPARARRAASRSSA